MQNVLINPLVTMYQTQIEASKRLTDVVFAGTQKIDQVVIGAAHRVFMDQLNFVQAITSLRDPKSLSNTLQSNFLSRGQNGAVSEQKEIMRIIAEMQNEISRSYQECIEQMGSHAASNVTRPLQAGQEQASDGAFNPVTSMFSVWESAFKEVAELAKRNMMAARSTMESTASKTQQGAANYANATADTVRNTTQNTVDTMSTAAGSMVNVARTATAAVMEDSANAERKVPQPLQPQSLHPQGGKKK